MNVGDRDGFGRFGIVDRDEDGVTCHECGRRFRMLVQHLRQRHGMTVSSYRLRHGLPAGTPLTARSTSAKISSNSRQRLGTDAWTRFETARDETLAQSRTLATAAAARPAPGTTARRRAIARERFTGRRPSPDDERHWDRLLAACVAHRTQTGRWPSRVTGEPDELELGRWVHDQRRALRGGRLTPRRRHALAAAGINLTPGRGSRPRSG